MPPPRSSSSSCAWNSTDSSTSGSPIASSPTPSDTPSDSSRRASMPSSTSSPSWVRRSSTACPTRGRRIISFVRGLAPRRDAQPRPTPNPPQTPPEEFQIKIETLTDRPPSSSSEIIIPETNPDDPAFATLVARARGLIPDVTPERVGVTIATYVPSGWAGAGPGGEAEPQAGQSAGAELAVRAGDPGQLAP